MSEFRLLVVTGMSGAGKSHVLHCLEDMGYFCVDNLPPVLISKFAEICRQGGPKVHHVALVVDIRGGEFFDALAQSLEQLGDQQIDYEVIFLEASDEALIRRYKETRRAHPLAPRDRLLVGIHRERERVAQIKEQAQHVIDTTHMRPAALKDLLQKTFSSYRRPEGFGVTVVSFGFKFGTPPDLDVMFDVRFLPNPYYIEEYRHSTGRVPEVAAFIAGHEVTQQFMEKLMSLMAFLVPQYRKEGKEQLSIGGGCPGGMHRSVWVAEELSRTLARDWPVRVEHRDLYRNEVRQDVWEDDAHALSTEEGDATCGSGAGSARE